MYSAYSILGLEEKASKASVKAAFEMLSKRLDITRFEPGSLGYRQCEQSIRAIKDAYETLTDAGKKNEYDRARKKDAREHAEEFRPKLGQLCVAAGYITLSQLEKAIEEQESIDLPIGQLLQSQQLISQNELDGLLLGQELISLPYDSPYALGRRLIAMGLVTEDMVQIALMESRSSGVGFIKVLTDSHWVDSLIVSMLVIMGGGSKVEKNG